MTLHRFVGRALVAAVLATGGALALPATAHASEPVPVLELRADPDLTFGDIQLQTWRTVGREVGAVTRALGVQTDGEELSSRQLTALVAGRSVDGAQLVGTFDNPPPDTTVGGATARMKIPGQNIIVIHAEIYIDGVLTPVLIIIILVR